MPTIINLLIIKGIVMRCPNCEFEGFDVWNSEFKIAELYLETEVACRKCGKHFEVEFGLKVEEIKEID